VIGALRVAGRELAFGPAITHVMAVVNLSPESRVSHSVVDGPDEALARARWARTLGASIVDLGAQSSHFENPELGADEELGRLLPALERLVDDGFVVSVDTWKPEVAEVAVAAGAAIVNDTGGLQDDRMVEVVAEHDVAAVLMHIEGVNPLMVGKRELSRGRPDDVAAALGTRASELRERGLDQLLVDPGLSINYRSDYESYGALQLETIRSLGELGALGYPVLVPVPRKKEDHRMVAYLTLSIDRGADVVRVHDIEEACDLVPMLGRELGVVT